ncbi:MAG: DUF2490 domain-containing protein [Chitinophagales bacterium]
MRKIFVISWLVIMSALGMRLSAQNWEMWTGVGADFSLGEKFTLETKELNSFQPDDNMAFNFAQIGLGLNYKINSDFSIEGGDQLNIIPSSSRTPRNRVYFRGTYTWRFSDVLISTHALQFELHGANEIRYDERIILINGISTRNRYTPINIRPSLSYWLYYNIGGDPVQYYDEVGNKTVKQAANGFHRGRLYFSLNSKLSDHFNMSVYVMHQDEFNLFTSAEHEINVVSPNTGNIARDFNEYNVIGLSLNFDIGN